MLTVITHLNAPKLADTSDAELAVLGVPCHQGRSSPLVITR